MINEYLESLCELTPLAVAVIEMPSQRYVLANSNYCRVLRTGLSPRELPGKTIPEVLGSEPHPQAMAALQRAHLHGAASRFEVFAATSVGAATTYWTGTTVPLLRDSQRTHVLGLWCDITDRVRMQQEAEQRSKDLENEKQRTKTFMAMAVHELRTPLTALRLLTQSLLFEAGQSPFAETVRRLDRQSLRLTRLITDLLNSVKADASQLELKLETVPIVRFLRSAVNRDSLAVSPDVIFHCLLEQETCVSIDKDRLFQILMNLVGNAAVHGGARTPIEVTLERALDGGIRLSVTDRGAGIEREDLERVFDRFYQGPHARGSSGLGLGLHICRLLVEKMRGRIWAESEGPGHGASFIVELPALAIRASA